MNNKVFTLPFLVSLFLLNTGFTFKPKLRAFYCGDYSQLIRSNQELIKQEEELFIFDKKGKSYQYSYSSNRVYPDTLKITPSSGTQFRLIKSYIEGSKFYVDYSVSVNGGIGSAELILDFERNFLSGSMSMSGITLPVPNTNCKEIELPKDTRFEYWLTLEFF